jgi:hypothetical protein
MHLNHIFIKQFEDLVESKIPDESERLNRLVKFTVGTVKDLVKAHLYEPKDIAYQNARITLEREYGNPYVVATAFARAIRDHPAIRPDNPALIRRFYLFLQKIRICASRSPAVEKEMGTQDNIRAHSMKLPYKGQEKWARRATMLWKERNTIPTLDQFSEFVKAESDVANLSDIRHIQTPDLPKQQ